MNQTQCWGINKSQNGVQSWFNLKKKQNITDVKELLIWFQLQKGFTEIAWVCFGMMLTQEKDFAVNKSMIISFCDQSLMRNKQVCSQRFPLKGWVAENHSDVDGGGKRV